MLRLLAVGVVSVIADAIGLIAAAVILDDMSIDAEAIVVSVLIFAAVNLVVEALVRQAAFRNAPALLGSSALVATLLSLIITVVLNAGMTISGLSTWVMATVIVWLVVLVARLLLPLVIFKNVLGRAADARRSR